MEQHPQSVLRDRGLPSMATLEEHGRSWSEVKPEYLIGFVGQSEGPNAANQTPAVMEMQRRLVVAIEASGDCAARQTTEVIRLTNTLRILTWVLIGIGTIQILMMVWKGGA